MRIRFSEYPSHRTIPNLGIQGWDEFKVANQWLRSSINTNRSFLRLCSQKWDKIAPFIKLVHVGGSQTMQVLFICFYQYSFLAFITKQCTSWVLCILIDRIALPLGSLFFFLKQTARVGNLIQRSRVHGLAKVSITRCILFNHFVSQTLKIHNFLNQWTKSYRSNNPLNSIQSRLSKCMFKHNFNPKSLIPFSFQFKVLWK